MAGLEGVGAAGDHFVERMAGFLRGEAPSLLGQLRGELDATMELTMATQAYFGEVQSPIKEMLGTLLNFITAYKAAQAEMQAKAQRTRSRAQTIA